MEAIESTLHGLRTPSVLLSATLALIASLSVAALLSTKASASRAGAFAQPVSGERCEYFLAIDVLPDLW